MFLHPALKRRWAERNLSRTRVNDFFLALRHRYNEYYSHRGIPEAAEAVVDNGAEETRGAIAHLPLGDDFFDDHDVMT